MVNKQREIVTTFGPPGGIPATISTTTNSIVAVSAHWRTQAIQLPAVQTNSLPQKLIYKTLA